MVNVLVNFFSITHLLEETTEDTNTAYPQYLEWETGICSTATLTDTWELRAVWIGNKIYVSMRCNSNDNTQKIIEIVHFLCN